MRLVLQVTLYTLGTLFSSRHLDLFSLNLIKTGKVIKDKAKDGKDVEKLWEESFGGASPVPYIGN